MNCHPGSRFHQEESYCDECSDDDHEELLQISDYEEMTTMSDDNHAAAAAAAARRGDANTFEPLVSVAGGIVSGAAESSFNSDLGLSEPTLHSSSSIPLLVTGPLMIHRGDEDDATTTTCRNWVGPTTTTRTRSIVSSVLLVEKTSSSSNPSYCFCCREAERSNHEQYNAFAPSPYKHNGHRHNDAATMQRIQEVVLNIIQEACDLLDKEEYSWEL